MAPTDSVAASSPERRRSRGTPVDWPYTLRALCASPLHTLYFARGALPPPRRRLFREAPLHARGPSPPEMGDPQPLGAGVVLGLALTSGRLLGMPSAGPQMSGLRARLPSCARRGTSSERSESR